MYHIGQMTVASATSKNNRNTAVPFAIPAGADSLLVLASGADCYAEAKLAVAGVTSFATTAALGVNIGATMYQIPLPSTQSASIVLAVFNNNVASRTVDVWAVYA